MRMTATAPLVRRKCAACEAEETGVQRQAMEEEEEVQRQPEEEEEPLELKRQTAEEEEDVMAKRAGAGPSIAPGAASAPASVGAARAIGALGSGRRLASAERAFFEPRFGADFSSVRIHDGPNAHRACRSVGARAFACGSDIAFARGEYTSGTATGRRLMAHELAHTLQRRNGSARLVRRWSKSGIQTELCNDRRGKRALRKLSRGRNPWKIIEFKTAYDKWRDDKTGAESENELKGLRGNTVRSAKEIRLRKSLSDRDAASVLFHESFHGLHPPKKKDKAGYLQNEIDARVATEKLHIRQGWPESVPGYRKKQGKKYVVDVAFIEKQIKGSSHYNPTGRTRIGRRYVGQKTIAGTWKCPKKKKP